MAEALKEPLLPATVAVMVMGPPTVTQVASPLLESIVATLESDEVHVAAKFNCAVGG